MLSYVVAILFALFMWEFAAVKVNLRLPAKMRKRLFRFGGRFALLAIVIELVTIFAVPSATSPFHHAFVQALFIAALPGELLKFAAINQFGRQGDGQSNPALIILVAVGISLGFAVLEIGLLGPGGLSIAAMLRSAISIPVHALFGFTMGAFMAMAWRVPLKTDKRMLALALAMPLMFHFSYDFLLLLNKFDGTLFWPKICLPILVLLEGVFALILTNHALSGAKGGPKSSQAMDPDGRRALGFSFIAIGLLVGAMFLNIRDPKLPDLLLFAVISLVLALDLGLLAYVRGTVMGKMRL